MLLQTVNFINGYSQPEIVKKNAKFGIIDANKLIIPIIYDTIFNFKKNKNICLACNKYKEIVPNEYIKADLDNYLCNYLNKKNEKLVIKTKSNDTCSFFSLYKNTYEQLNENILGFVVYINDKKYLIDTAFLQLTFEGYYNIKFSADPNFYIAELKDENENIFTGLINLQEKVIVPFNYSNIKLNTSDSLIITCTSGVGEIIEDVIFNYKGKKIIGFEQHIEMATKNYIIYKLFEPKDHFMIYNIKTKEEKNLKADEIKFYNRDDILIRINNNWCVYDLKTNKMKKNEKNKNSN